jgi:F-box and WD-40 domain protein MET30
MATRMTKSDNMDSHNALSDNVTANTAFSSRFHASSSQDITDPQASFKTVEHSTDGLPHSPPVSAKRRRTSLDKTNRSTLDIIGLSVTSQAAAQNVAPYLAKHIPTKYNPEGGTPSIASTMETKPIYCNRHRPDTKCWRQANEPTMEELQNVGISILFKSFSY